MQSASGVILTLYFECNKEKIVKNYMYSAAIIKLTKQIAYPFLYLRLKHAAVLFLTYTI